MNCELLVVPDCPHTTEAEALFRSVLSRVGPGVPVQVVVIDDQSSATCRGFVGSPAFFVDGRDLFPVPGAPAAVACRVYRDEHGALRGLPGEHDLSVALSRSVAAGPKPPGSKDVRG